MIVIIIKRKKKKQICYPHPTPQKKDREKRYGSPPATVVVAPSLSLSSQESEASGLSESWLLWPCLLLLFIWSSCNSQVPVGCLAQTEWETIPEQGCRSPWGVGGVWC